MAGRVCTVISNGITKERDGNTHQENSSREIYTKCRQRNASCVVRLSSLEIKDKYPYNISKAKNEASKCMPVAGVKMLKL